MHTLLVVFDRWSRGSPGRLGIGRDLHLVSVRRRGAGLRWTGGGLWWWWWGTRAIGRGGSSDFLLMPLNLLLNENELAEQTLLGGTSQ